MPFVLILIMITSPGQSSITSQQIGTYLTLQECDRVKELDIEKMKKDTGLIVEGSCVPSMEGEDKEVKLYLNGKDTDTLTAEKN